MPGKLSVSRAIGDIEAKNPTFGGNPNVVIAIPEIKYFDINNKYDFIIVGSKYDHLI
jgi:protein phosphatase 2C family protein 2/3